MELNKEIKRFFSSSNINIQLILVNIAVFVLVKIVYLFLFLFNSQTFTSADFIMYLAVPAGFKQLLFKFWTPITYMFLHESFWHILGNMLWLFFLGNVFLLFIDKKKFFATYILGGLSGAALYILAYNIFPVFSDSKYYAIALGASASVTAIVIAISTFQPDFNIRPFGLFNLKLKWLAIFFVLYDLLSITDGNAGGHIAHIGGAIFGFYFSTQLSKGKDVTKGFNRLIDNFVTFFSGNKKPKMKEEYNKNRKKKQNNSSDIPKSDYEYNKAKADEQNEVDRILDKISKYGYDSLSSKEKDFLFKFSKK